MKTKSSMHGDSFSSPQDARIDAALRAYGRAIPSPGLESRIAARLSAMSFAATPLEGMKFRGKSRLFLLRGFSIGALAAAAACGIVVGTVRHSQRLALPVAGRPLQSDGLSNAHAIHIPTRAVPQSASINPEAPRSAPHGRATVQPGRKPTGAAAPSSPYPADKPRTSGPQQ